MKKTTLGVLAIMAFLNLNAQKNAAYIAYIEQYSEIAMVEQARHKIPASITLAQALLESGAGKSQLHKRATTISASNVIQIGKAKKSITTTTKKENVFANTIK